MRYKKKKKKKRTQLNDYVQKVSNNLKEGNGLTTADKKKQLKKTDGQHFNEDDKKSIKENRLLLPEAYKYRKERPKKKTIF